MKFNETQKCCRIFLNLLYRKQTLNFFYESGQNYYFTLLTIVNTMQALLHLKSMSVK